MNHKITYAFFLLIFAFGILSCSRNNSHGMGMPPTEVTTFTVVSKDIPADFESVGVAASSHQVEIRSQVRGYLLDLAYKEGGVVEEGDLLFQIDPRPFQAALDTAKGDLAQQEALLWDATQSVNRLEPLLAEKATSKRDYETALAQKLSLQAAVQSSQAKVREAELNLEYTSIRSPISGVSDQSKFREGSLILADSLLTVISVIDPIWVQFSLSESDMLKFSREKVKRRLMIPEDKDYEVEVKLADGTKFPRKGRLNYKAPTYDQKTGSLMWEAQLQNPEEILLPGQFVRVNVTGGVWVNAIAIPQKAVQQSQKGTFVYVVDQGKAEIRYVEPGDWYKDLWIIEKGLNAGEEVIVEGINKVAPGSPVIIKNESL
jgi:membrane fusion protein (multidrug efflux system)